MPLSSETPETPCQFTEDELTMLGKTADALTAYLGQPILAEVDATEDGHEWVAFAVPLGTNVTLSEEDIRIQMGGAKARWVGNKGGLTPGAGDTYDCRYLWGIQLCPEKGRRYTKLDHEGEECGWSDHLADLLPFVLTDEQIPDDLDDDDESDEDDGDGPVATHRQHRR